jgi:hypothetical protein
MKRLRGLLLALSIGVPLAAQTLQISPGGVGGGEARHSPVQRPLSNDSCDPPAIHTFSSFPDQLADAGAVTLSWDADADSVDIAQVGNGLDPGGTATFQVSGSITLNITARSACGTATASLLVPVGPPAIQSITPLTGSGNAVSAGPGDLAGMTFGNLADPSDISVVVFRSASGLSASALPIGVSEDGSVLVRVPLLADMTQPGGYDTGSFFVSAVAGELTSAEIPYTVLPLATVSDAVGTFQQMLTNLFDQINPAFAQLVQSPDLAPIASAIQPALNSQQTVLQQIASDLAASGTSTFLEADPSPDNPAPDSATVTVADLQLYLAYHLSVNAMPAAGSPAAHIVHPSARAAALDAPRLADGSCLAVKDLRVAPCIVIEAVNDGLQEFADQLDNQLLKQAGKLKLFSGAAKIAGRINQALTIAKLTCWLAPIHLAQFSLAPNTILNIGRQYDPTGVAPQAGLTALLSPDPNSVIAFLENRLENAAVNELTPKNAQYAPLVKQLAKNSADEIYGGLNYLISQLNLKPGPLATETIQVGACDITRVIANGENRQGVSQFVIHAPRDPEGQPFYYFWGRRLGTATMDIQPIVEHFLFAPSAFSSNSCSGTPAITDSVLCYTPLYVSTPKRLLVTAYHSCAYPDDDPDGGYPCRTSVAIPQGQVIMSGSKFSQKAFDNSYSLVSVSPAGGSTWMISISGAAIQQDPSDPTTWFDANNSIAVEAVNPPNANNTQRVVVNLAATGQCSGGITINPETAAPITVVNFTGPISQTFNYPGSPGASITVGTYELANAACSLTVTVQLLNN